MTSATATIPSTVLPASLRTVPASEKYVVKSFTQHETSRGVSMSGNLYRGTKKVAVLEDRGMGGDIEIHFIAKVTNDIVTDAERAARDEEVRRFRAWAEEWVALNPGGLFGSGNATWEDTLFVLMDEAGRMKDLNRGKGLTVLTPDEAKEGTRFRRFDGVDLGRAGHRKQLCDQVSADALYWDKTTKAWKKVADAR